MIDVFYVLGSGSKWQNNEIRYSLRTLEKYGHNVGQVYIVGQRPSFISDKIKYIRAADIGTPACNHWYKVKRFFIETGIKRACYMMDDIFFIKDVDLENYPYYCHEELKKYDDSWKNHYHKMVETTKMELEKFYEILKTEMQNYIDSLKTKDEAVRNSYWTACYYEILDFFENLDKEDWDENWSEIIGEYPSLTPLHDIMDSYQSFSHPEYYNLFCYEGLCDTIREHFRWYKKTHQY